MLKKIVDIGFILLIILGLASCASGGGSAGLITATDTTPPPSTTPTYTPPAWEGITYREDDPDSEQGAEFTYNRIKFFVL